MSDYFEVTSSAGKYGVQIGYGLLAPESKTSPQKIIICDRIFAAACQNLGFEVISFEALESLKNLDQVGAVIIALRTLGVNRGTKLLAIGGGVIQDIATIVASLYMRGLQWDYMPTTLLGMVDSCIGGKSSINAGAYKNLIGNFYPPKRIIIDLNFVDTLNEEQKAAGLFEAVKICFAATGEAFENYLRLDPGLKSTREEFRAAIELSLLTKRWFIEIDEYDREERLLLNFGHTFGHAIESASDFAVPHGIAVGLGMLAALAFAKENEHFTDAPQRVLQLRSYVTNLLAGLDNLPLWIQRIALPQLMNRFEADKKHSDSHFLVIVPDAGGNLKRLALEKNTSSRQMLSSAFLAACRIASSCKGQRR